MNQITIERSDGTSETVAHLSDEAMLLISQFIDRVSYDGVDAVRALLDSRNLNNREGQPTLTAFVSESGVPIFRVQHSHY